MNSIGTLKILIEGDASGLTSQLKRAGNSITSFVGQMNRQEVNWTSILSRTISPAIISGIAATFATGLTGILSFSNQLGSVAASSGTTFIDAFDKMSQAILTLQANTGASTGTLARGYVNAFKPIQNSSDALEIVGNAAAYSNVAMQGSSDATEQLSGAFGNLFNIFGVTGATSIQSGMATITQAAGKSRYTLGEFIDILTSIAPQLHDLGIPLDKAAIQLATISTQSGMTGDAVKEVFTKMADAIQQPYSPLNSLGTKYSSIAQSIRAEGLDGTFVQIANKLKTAIDSGDKILTNKFGFTPETMSIFDTAKLKLSDIRKEEGTMKDNILTWGEYIKSLETPISNLRKDWGTVKTAVENLVLNSGLLKWLDGILTKTSDILALLGYGPNAKGTSKFDFKEFLGAIGVGASTGVIGGSMVLPGLGTVGGGLLGGLATGVADLYKQMSGNTSTVANNQTTNNNITNNNISSNVNSGNKPFIPYNTNYGAIHGYYQY